MSAVKIADGGQYFAQFSGDGRLACAGIAGQDDVHTHLLLTAQTALGALDAVLHGVGYLPDGLLHLVHTDEGVEVGQDIMKGALLRHIAPDVGNLYLGGGSAAADEGREDVLGRLHGQMSIAKGLVLGLDLIFKEALQLAVGFGCKCGNAIFHPKVLLGDVAKLPIAGYG